MENNVYMVHTKKTSYFSVFKIANSLEPCGVLFGIMIIEMYDRNW